MGYLSAQIWICLLIAAAIGFITGWSLRHDRFKQRERHLETNASPEPAEVGQAHGPTKAQSEGPARPTDSKADKAAKGDLDTGKGPALATDEGQPLKPSYRIEEIGDIGGQFGSRLRDLAIETTQDLLDRCARAEGRQSIADSMGLEEPIIRKWAGIADLMRVPGVSPHYAEWLEALGVDSVQELGHRNPNKLARKLTKGKARKGHKAPRAETVADWIRSAKSLAPIITTD